MRKSSSKTSRWETSTGCLNIQPAFVSHSGEYWCEDGGGRRSNSVNITIKGGGVILESPALPVMEQQNVTLRCRLKGTSSNLPADFIKEGHMNMVTYKGEMTIHNVSKSDEGLYKCRISGREESAGSWLAVRESQRSHQKPQGSTSAYFSPTPRLGQETSHPQLSTLLSVVFTISCLAVLLLVVGILQCWKQKAACFSSEMPETVSNIAFPASEHTNGDDQHMTLYGCVTKPKKKRAYEHSPVDDPCVTIYDDVTTHEERKKKKAYEHSPVDDPCVTIYDDVTTHEERKKKKAYEHSPVDDPCVTIYDDVTTHEERKKKRAYEHAPVDDPCVAIYDNEQTTKRGHRKEKHLRDGRDC
ncbi:uncharacterized protein LOC109142973 [Larimichthys crocea]|uniref:uncharacterized protein LOC109142973 n=1 Tax=Larimichthys crocea TaxID=215358 RepID=UPI000F5F2E45|nr:uncharacterized protein LOC109142973 [Larimichthys crocea]